ncbi:MAG: fructosamine kinase family protein [Planctomycetota bacterium]|nr:fructosamine kinase family protein [Planctomycetota bacterium]
MSGEAAIERALADAGLPTSIRSLRELSGGCIHRVCEVTLDDDSRIVAKMNRADQVLIFREEAAGLTALAETNTVLVPRPLSVGAHGDTAILLMTALAPAPGTATDRAWRSLGEELAALHAVDVGRRYGFHADNHLGSTFQPNTFCDDWVDFNARYRLGFQVELGRQNGLIGRDEARRLEMLIDRLGEFIPASPKPALLHGDLWSGNALPTVDEEGEARIAVIDPATSIGDGWADIAMMKLFGGFPPSCFDAYARAVDDHDRVESRIVVYQLYHVLNHVNIFGRGYAGQAMSLVGTLGC